MKKSRRDFLKKLPLAMSIPFTLGGIPFKALGQGLLAKIAEASATDKVLVILQMHGGNDGLNCLIPVERYSDYFSVRQNIAIPTPNKKRGYVNLDSTLPIETQVGLHPDMQAMKHMYDAGKMTVVQGVSYKQNNGSHFRGRDISFMGGGFNDYFDSGWLGRYLNETYAPYKYPEDFLNPTVPGNQMRDPLALELGNDTSLIFHQSDSIPTSISLSSVPGFYDLISKDLEGFEDEIAEILDNRGVPPVGLDGSPYQKEMEWILGLEDKSRDYSEILYERYVAGKASNIVYPELYPFNAPQGSLHNPLSHQLKMVARLLGGGCKTRVFLVKIGGFDTHADQVEKYDSTMGGHAALMYHISTAMNAFLKDLKGRGLENEVLTITTSEFGRRVDSNGSYGTDHGTAGPLFIFGAGASGGVVGEAFKTADATAPYGNLAMQVDYRNVYANILRTWMGVTDDKIMNKIFPDSRDPNNEQKGIMNQASDGGTADGTKFVEMPIVTTSITDKEGFVGDRFSLEDCYPNPAVTKTTIHFKINSAYDVNVDLYDVKGIKVKEMVKGFFTPGTHKVEVDLTGIPAGNYIYQLKSGFYTEAKKLVIKK
ncbi:DUF1501 domain-containing protein [Pseudochryseolinea flava]|uniref:Secretion system C-terminal sorting domain-containing protein n=1 Tax=Pseudochryseolinea flava TaxID=2059302 RepID=A0A364Y3D5_9BACT|nr:DUF1501 domain-containing protein [Pseudochryseolinea flava]RAW01320.1 hypothetical protein DQQ10_10460 [Pseudochryseolinea flava]